MDSTRFRVATTCEPDNACSTPSVLVPRDSALLIESADLPGSIFDQQRMITDRELSDLADLIDAGSWSSMSLRRPKLMWDPLATSLMHYNRVEGFTFGTSAAVELEPLSLRGSLWMGTAEPLPGFTMDLS